jgi:monovalent cation:H+ antiporter-2, CPA2 family
MNTLLWPICLLCFTTLGMMFLLKKLKQPYLIAYIIAGIVLGPSILKAFTKPDEIEIIGEIGILLMMFFLGTEINVPDNRSLLVRPVIAQGMKTVLSIAFAFLIGNIMELPFKSIILIAILFVFNSTAVVSEFLRKHNTLKTAFGLTILNMLILQDLLLAPVLTLLKVWSGSGFNFWSIVLPVIVCIVIFFVFKKIRNSREIKLWRFFRVIGNDHDLQVFSGLLICLGFGLFAEVIGLSSALGSFIAGILVGRINVFNWLERSLASFKVFFVTLFFISIGLRIDISYLYSNYQLIFLGTLVVLMSNSLMSAIVFRLLKYNWKDSWYGGAMLSQTGEFGILALSIAYKAGIIEYGLYKTGLGITCLSLLLSTIWITILKKVI